MDFRKRCSAEIADTPSAESLPENVAAAHAAVIEHKISLLPEGAQAAAWDAIIAMIDGKRDKQG